MRWNFHGGGATKELLKHNSTTPIVLSTTHATVYIYG